MHRGRIELSEYRFTGGCQCGAVRYAFTEPLADAHICHCRMCQKAVGAPFAIFVPVWKPSFSFTRGKPAEFQSSEMVRRGFCSACGTPLTFDEGDDGIGILVGTLDDRERIQPTIQCGVESRVSWFDKLSSLPGDIVTYADDPEKRDRIIASSRQHPDHDTAVWPPAD